jgi:hypothetical protein
LSSVKSTTRLVRLLPHGSSVRWRSLLKRLVRSIVDLARAVAPDLDVQLLLERVSEGSIRCFFRILLEQLDDEALRTLDWKPFVGQYLVKAKHALLRWLQERDRILTRDEVIELQEILAQLAPSELGLGLLPPGTIPLENLLADIQAISQGVRELRGTDAAVVISRFDKTAINKSLSLTDDDVARLLIKDKITGEDELVLPVKKPDYLGRSMWEFRLGAHNIEAKICDDEWLARFQRGDIPLAPGDAIKAVVRTEISRGFWLLGDIAAVTALLDRLLHHAHVLKCRPRGWRTRGADRFAYRRGHEVELIGPGPRRNCRFCAVHKLPVFNCPPRAPSVMLAASRPAIESFETLEALETFTTSSAQAKKPWDRDGTRARGPSHLPGAGGTDIRHSRGPLPSCAAPRACRQRG